MIEVGFKHRLKLAWVRIRSRIDTAGAYSYDLRQYLRWSSTLGADRGQNNLAAKITERYHAIEKGLSLPRPRPGFGSGVIPGLLRHLNTYGDRYGSDHITLAAGGALAAYRQFNLDAGLTTDELPSSQSLMAAIERFAPANLEPHGTLTIRREDILTATAAIDLHFFNSRHSTRMFSDQPVTNEQIQFAVAAAATAPAVCNREFLSVHIWDDSRRIQEILAVQGGARGFGDGIPTLAVVAADRRAYWSAAERNQCWIDGGSFAMAFILGLHAQGLGTLPLNWSKTPRVDRQMRALIGLPGDHAIIMFIGFGNLLPEYRVAASPRRPITEFGRIPGVY